MCPNDGKEPRYLVPIVVSCKVAFEKLASQMSSLEQYFVKIKSHVLEHRQWYGSSPLSLLAL